MDVLGRLTSLELLVVTGKGGTGKSVLTAALGRVLAGRGRRTLILEVDPRENLHHLCGVPPSGGEIVEVQRRLYLQNLKPDSVVDWVVKKKVRIGLLADKVLASPIYQRFVEGAPGMTPLAVLGHALRLVRGELAEAPPIDTVVLDAPATGHGVYLLTAPRLFNETIGEGPFAQLAHGVASFVEDPARTGLVIVTLAEEMPVEETLELIAALDAELGRRPELLVTNALYPPIGGADGGCVVPPRSPQGDDAPIDGLPDAGGDALRDLWRERRRINEKERARILEHWPGPRVELPLLAIDEGPGLVAALAERLDAALEVIP